MLACWHKHLVLSTTVHASEMKNGGIKQESGGFWIKMNLFFQWINTIWWKGLSQISRVYFSSAVSNLLTGLSSLSEYSAWTQLWPFLGTDLINTVFVPSPATERCRVMSTIGRPEPGQIKQASGSVWLLRVPGCSRKWPNVTSVQSAGGRAVRSGLFQPVRAPCAQLFH